MDNEQKIGLLKLISTHCKCPDEGYGSCDVCELAVREIIQDIDRAEKYEWHSLRENPGDLPTCDDNEKVLVHLNDEIFKDWIGTVSAFSVKFKRYNFDKWKYIEPF